MKILDACQHLKKDDPVEECFRIKSRVEAIDLMRKYYKKGFRYAARDEQSDWIQLYSEEPKKYLEEEFWGYKSGDDPNVLPVRLIKNKDMTEINWGNRSAILIETYWTEPELFEPESVNAGD